MTIEIPKYIFQATIKEATSLLDVARKLNINWKTARRLLKKYELSPPSGQSIYHAKNEKTDRNKLIVKMKQNGRTYGEIGASLGISRQRVYKILKKWINKE